ncbi:gamma-glutamyltransferase [Vibrio nigripulchritudo]|uniref:gamma-glutamyltransferase n=1 Tax=Vibrio nigripulchritudo TaxID=28173 RepID=UPI00190B0508|nr:gamma-glutamyltransferase [Vibrio nigripulchritudo]BCL73432.1 gamma-glutamyltransferase [Vibrio nigripulchritudo]BDU34799.1 gamma-glutamyltransferase [Vibrio nigripulchritudo]
MDQISNSLKLSKNTLHSKKGMVTSQNKLASHVGVDILNRGGNAVDAAIATSFALGAAEPWMSGIGGGGYMMVLKKGEHNAQVIDFGMRSPANLNLTDYPLTSEKGGDLFNWPRVKNDHNIKGAKAVAIPGCVAGMGLAHECFGTVDWSSLIQPAISLAKKGLSVDWYCQLILSGAAADLSACQTMKDTFFDDSGFPKSSPWNVSTQNICNLEKLACSLESIAKNGSAEFYEGALAQSIVADLNRLGGHHTLNDFKSYRAQLKNATRFLYRGNHVYITPDMTAGPTLKRAFNLLERALQPDQSLNAKAYSAFDQVFRKSYQERLVEMGDIESEGMPSCTTHFNVIDSEGTLVSVTQTLVSIFGSRIMLPTSGIIPNNGIMWFDPEPGKPNSLAPNKKCLSNMCPVLIARKDGTSFAIGASGGRKIMPAVAQLSSFIMDYNMNAHQAMHAPRIDTSQPDKTYVDEALGKDILRELEGVIEHSEAVKRSVYPYTFACPSIIESTRAGNFGITEISSPWADCATQ